MQISNFQPSTPDKMQRDIIQHLFMMQSYRSFKVQKPLQQSSTPQPKSENKNKQPQKFTKTTDISKAINKSIQLAIVQHVQKNMIDIQKEKKVQRLHNIYLEHFLNITNLEAVLLHEPPLLSLLESKDEGDYIQSINRQYYEKKDYPHYSNAIKLTQLPNQVQYKRRSCNNIIQPLQKFPQKYWNIEQNCTYKVKTILKFTKQLFYQGYQQFDNIAQKIKTSICNCKLLFDVYQDFFKIEERIDNSRQQNVEKNIKRVNKFILQALKKYKDDFVDANDIQPLYRKFEENYICLKDFRRCLTRKMEEDDSGSSQ